MNAHSHASFCRLQKTNTFPFVYFPFAISSFALYHNFMKFPLTFYDKNINSKTCLNEDERNEYA